MSIVQNITARLQAHTQLTAGPKTDKAAGEILQYLTKHLGKPTHSRNLADRPGQDPKTTGGSVEWEFPLDQKSTGVVRLRAEGGGGLSGRISVLVGVQKKDRLDHVFATGVDSSKIWRDIIMKMHDAITRPDAVKLKQKLGLKASVLEARIKGADEGTIA